MEIIILFSYLRSFVEFAFYLAGTIAFVLYIQEKRRK